MTARQVDRSRLGVLGAMACWVMLQCWPLFANAGTNQDGCRVYLKLDDLTTRRSSGYPQLPVSKQWYDAFDVLSRHQAKASIGVIGESLNLSDPQFEKYIRQLIGRGLISIFNHGFFLSNTDPSMQGFNGPGVAVQEEQIKRTNELIQLRLGVTPFMFGPHAGAVDRNTAQALSRIPSMTTVWFYGEQLRATGWQGINIPRLVELESPIFKPSLQSIQLAFEKRDFSPDTVVALQGHPDMWSAVELGKFQSILSFLKGKGCNFEAPSK